MIRSAHRPVDRRRDALDRLRELTTAAAVGGVAATAGFGLIAAADNSGQPGATSINDLRATHAAPQVAPRPPSDDGATNGDDGGSFVDPGSDGRFNAPPPDSVPFFGGGHVSTGGS